jgi:hypothetical protein
VLTGPEGPLQEQARLQQAPGSSQLQGPPARRQVVIVVNKVVSAVIVLVCSVLAMIMNS